LSSVRITRQNSVDRSVVTTWKCKRVVTRMEFRTGLFPPLLLFRRLVTQASSLVDTSMQAADLFRIPTNHFLHRVPLHQTVSRNTLEINV